MQRTAIYSTVIALTAAVGGISLCLLPGELHAEEVSPQCYGELPGRFFSRDIVIRALELYKVNQNQWLPIVDELHNQGNKISDIVRNQARKMLKDPYVSPAQPEVIKNLFIAELEKLFSQVLNEHNIQYSIIDRDSIHKMFQYILDNNQGVFTMCTRPF